ncbi:MAG: NAD(P)H-dependent oxidoreductase [Actinomycetota bacterium]|nr:NAD(P)H-dependent oxidoreductase [Actinomycetota bacterium]
MPVDILLICGSLRTGSTNAAALRCAQEVAPAGCQVVDYQDLAALPHFNPDDDVQPLAPVVAQLRSQIGQAGALLFCTPEYAGALPGSLKNLLDWTIGGGEMSGKRVGWINSSDRGAAGAYAELATVLGYADTVMVAEACRHIPVSRSEVAADGSVSNPDIRQQLAAVVGALWADRIYRE